MRLPLPLIDTTGASAAAPVPTYNPDTDELEFAAGGGGGGVVDSVVAGTGISVDSTDPANPIVSATAVSGGTGKDRRWNVGAGETSIDEFNDDSLAAAWTRVDGAGAPAGNLAWSEGADDLGFKNIGGDATATLHGLVRPLSGVGGPMANGDGFVTYLSLLGAPANYSLAGLVLADGNTHGAGKQVVADIVFSSTAVGINGAVYTNWNTRNSTAEFNPRAGHAFYLRLALISAGSWRVDISVDGRLWKPGPTIAQALTPTHVGFCSTSFGTATDHQGAFEFIRRVSGVT